MILTFDATPPWSYYLTYQYRGRKNYGELPSMAMNLKGKACLITGGTSGIGAATALLFAQQGAHIAVVARKPDSATQQALQSAAKAAGGNFVFIQADVSIAEDCNRCVDEASAALGGLDILIHSAGGAAPGGLLDVTEEVWQFEEFALKPDARGWRLPR